MHGANAARPVTPIGQPGNLHHPRNRTRTICREDPISSRQVARNATRETRHTGAAGCLAPHLMCGITAVIHRIDQTRTGAPHPRAPHPTESQPKADRTQCLPGQPPHWRRPLPRATPGAWHYRSNTPHRPDPNRGATPRRHIRPKARRDRATQDAQGRTDGGAVGRVRRGTTHTAPDRIGAHRALLR